MEKQSYVSPGQVIAALVITHLLYSTVHFLALHAGRSIQDILPAVLVAFAMNFVIALPLLALLKRHQGKDPVECAANIFGRGAGAVTGIVYFFFFGCNAVLTQIVFRNYYVDAVVSEAKTYAIMLPLLAIVVYMVCKGFESIMRFGTIIFAIYALVMIVLVVTLIPSVRPSIGARFLFPLFFNGPGIFLHELLSQFNQDMQIVALAFCAPFLKSGVRLGKVFAKWNLLTFLMVFVLFTLCVVVLGPFGANQMFPLQSLAAQSSVSAFDRLDPLYAMSWMLNTVLTVALFTCLQVQCLEKMGFNKHRTARVIIVGLLNTVAVYILQGNEALAHAITLNWYWAAINLFVTIVLPLVLLIGDCIVRGRRAEHGMA
ncbi:MAG: GerAB/ArcD/ProY family transporter [Ethanoligenens sp.]